MIVLIEGCQCLQIRPQVACDISFQFDRCRCRCLDIVKIKSLDPSLCDLNWDSKTKDFDIETCEGITGFYIDDIIKYIKPEANKSLQCYEDTCSSK